MKQKKFKLDQIMLMLTTFFQGNAIECYTCTSESCSTGQVGCISTGFCYVSTLKLTSLRKDKDTLGHLTEETLSDLFFFFFFNFKRVASEPKSCDLFN